MLRPIVKTYWRKGNSLAIIESAKQRMREVHLGKQIEELEAKLKGVTEWDKVIKIIEIYCDVR